MASKKPNRMGGTFAERKAAREGADFEAPEQPETGNTTFAERSGKAVPNTGAENKSVKASSKKS